MLTLSDWLVSVFLSVARFSSSGESTESASEAARQLVKLFCLN